MCYVVFFKQKTAYEMRISDWSSDVCSSDLRSFAIVITTQPDHCQQILAEACEPAVTRVVGGTGLASEIQRLRQTVVGRTTRSFAHGTLHGVLSQEIGRASGRERGCQ